MTQRRAMLCALAAFFAWVLFDVCIKLTGLQTLSPFIVMMVLGAVGSVGIAVLTLSHHPVSILRPRNLWGQGLICLCAIVMNYACVIGLRNLPLTIFYIILFTAPLIIAVLSSTLKHEAPTKTKYACVVAGFAGVVVALWTQGWGDHGRLTGYVASLSIVCAFSASTVTMRRIAPTDTMQSIQFLNAVAVFVVGAAISFMQSIPFPDFRIFAIIAVAGVINIAAGILFNKALENTSSTNVAQLHYTQIISGAILAYFIWGDVPNWSLVLGSLIIIASGLVVAVQAHKSDLLPANPTL